MNGPRLGPVIVLPAAPTMAAGEILRAFGVTKAAVSLWRARQGFPAALRDGRTTVTETAAIAAWLAAHGVAVRWI